MYKKTITMKMNQFLKINAVAIAAVMFTGSIMSFKIAEKRQNQLNITITVIVLQLVLSLKSLTGQKDPVHHALC